MQKSRLSRFSRRPIDLSPGLLIGVQLCARSRDFEPLKRDVSVIITHAPFTTENSRFLFFFFFFGHPSFNLPSFTIRMVMFSERFRWFGERDSSVKRYRRTRFIFVNKWTLAFNCCSLS